MNKAGTAELDAAVSRLEGWAPRLEPVEHWLRDCSYCRDWSMAGPIIEREAICIAKLTATEWHAFHPNGAAGREGYHSMNGKHPGYLDCCAVHADGAGPTPLIAAMRAFVASKALAPRGA